MQKLSQVVAVIPGIKSRAKADIDALYHVGQKTDPFNGLNRVYAPKNDEGDKLPPEKKIVQLTVPSVLKRMRETVGGLMDAEATMDFANCSARADVVVDGAVVIKEAPVTFLMFLEKAVTDMHTIVGKLPTLSTDEEWTLDPSTSTFKSEPVETLRTSKEVEPLVLYPATDKHPAQTDKITRDRTVGTWTQTKLSGAMPVSQKEALLARLERLSRAVKYAREQANTIDAPPITAADNILGWLFAGKEG